MFLMEGRGVEALLVQPGGDARRSIGKCVPTKKMIVRARCLVSCLLSRATLIRYFRFRKRLKFVLNPL